MGLIFGKTTESSPKEMVREWCQRLRKENFHLDRQLLAIQREEQKIKRLLKEASLKGDNQLCSILIKEIVRARKAASKICTGKAHLSSVQMQLNNQLAVLRITGSLQASTEVMQAMHALVRLPEVAHTMQKLSQEMMHAGVIEDILDETMMASVEGEEQRTSPSETEKIFKALEADGYLPGAGQMGETSMRAERAKIIALLLEETKFATGDEVLKDAYGEVDKMNIRDDVSKTPWILKIVYYGISLIYHNFIKFVFGVRPGI